MRTPSPPPRPDAIEDIKVEYFTIDSLYKMLAQFKQVAPDGLVSVKLFGEIFNDLIFLNFENEILPEQWTTLNSNQIDTLAKTLASNSDFIDWHIWLLAASTPYPFPTKAQLLDLLKRYKTADRNNTKSIDKATFERVN